MNAYMNYIILKTTVTTMNQFAFGPMSLQDEQSQLGVGMLLPCSFVEEKKMGRTVT